MDDAEKTINIKRHTIPSPSVPDTRVSPRRFLGSGFENAFQGDPLGYTLVLKVKITPSAPRTCAQPYYPWIRLSSLRVIRMFQHYR